MFKACAIVVVFNGKAQFWSSALRPWPNAIAPLPVCGSNTGRPKRCCARSTLPTAAGGGSGSNLCFSPYARWFRGGIGLHPLRWDAATLPRGIVRPIQYLLDNDSV